MIGYKRFITNAQRHNHPMSQPSNAPTWPRKEAQKLWHHLEEKIPNKGYVLFATGYGPSGLPHIGTFGEVARTAMVRKALSEITDAPTRLYVFSDDMDGLRSVPDHIPQPAMLKENLGKPLSAIPDPFGTHGSYAAHNNALLQEFSINLIFLMSFNRQRSSTEAVRMMKCYRRFCSIMKMCARLCAPF